MALKHRRNDQHQQERGQEYRDGRGERAPEPGNQESHEGGRDHHRPRAHHPDRDGDEKVARGEPAVVLHQALLEEGDDDQSTAEGEAARLQEEQHQLADDRRRRRVRRADGADSAHRHNEPRGDRGWPSTPKQRAVVQQADHPGDDEEHGDLRLEHHGDDESRRRDRPLQPVLHAELGEPPAGVHDHGDHRRTDAVEHRRHPAQSPEMDVEGGKGGDDQEVRQDEAPASGPCAPEPAAHVGGEYAHLDRQGSRQRLADGDGVAHFRPGQPVLLLDQLPLHLAAERGRAAEAKAPQPQKVSDKVDQLDALDCRFVCHRSTLQQAGERSRAPRSGCLDEGSSGRAIRFCPLSNG